MSPTRRAVLGGGCAVGAATLLWACGEGGSVATPTREADGALRVPQADTAVGSSTYYPGTEARIIVTQPAEGRWHAFDATCPHQGCMVSGREDDGSLICPCHGSAFDPATGEPVGGPALEALTTRTVEVDGEDLLIRG